MAGTIRILAFLLALGTFPLSGEVLYSTDFDSFPTGENSWAGIDGWVSNNTNDGVVAIDDGLFAGALGKTAALGFSRPSNSFTTVFRPINYDPSTGSPLLGFVAFFGIEDSTGLTQFRRDDFFFNSLPGSMFNDAGIDRDLSFTDSTAGSNPMRFYRLVRT